MNFFFPTAAATLLLLAGCSDAPEPQYPDQFANGGNGAQAPTGPGGMAQGGMSQGGAGAAATTPAGSTGAGGANDSFATPIPPLMAAAAQPLLTEMASSEARGMKPDGAVIAGQFLPGQILEQPITLQPGRCYAVVGVGIGLTELDAEIVIHHPPAPEYVAAVHQKTGPQAVLGGGGNCFKNPLPVAAPAKVRIRATGGQGLALAQTFSR